MIRSENEDYELKQARDMSAARKRWEALVKFLSFYFFCSLIVNALEFVEIIRTGYKVFSDPGFAVLFVD